MTATACLPPGFGRRDGFFLVFANGEPPASFFNLPGVVAGGSSHDGEDSPPPPHPPRPIEPWHNRCRGCIHQLHSFRRRHGMDACCDSLDRHLGDDNIFILIFLFWPCEIFNPASPALQLLIPGPLASPPSQGGPAATDQAKSCDGTTTPGLFAGLVPREPGWLAGMILRKASPNHQRAWEPP